MLPSVAYQSSPQFLPHERLDHPPSATASIDQQSYDLANAALDAALRCPLENMPGRPYQPVSSSRTRHQYPQPIQRPNAQSMADSGLNTGINHPEHCLRRKTPNGTIAAGFDATPGAGEGSIQPPAMKHIIVSSLDNTGQVLSSSQNGLLSDTGQYNSATTPVAPSQYHHQQPNFPSGLNYDATSNRTAYSGSIPQNAHGGNWIRSLNYPSGTVDPLLNQASAQPQPQQLQRHYWQNGPTIPTVIASSFQPGRDQSSSLGLGQYGPYWPDGGYTPFYPAALRDSRYQSTPSLLPPHVQDDPLATYQTPFNRQSIPSSDHVTPGFSWNPLPAQSGHQAPQVFNNNHNHHHRRHHRHHRHHHAANSFSSRHNVPPQNSSEPAPLWAAQQPHSYNAGHHAQPGVEGGFSTQSLGPSTDSLQAPPPVDISSQPRNTEFKEKILSWAHSIYVDLLTSLPSARKNRLSQGTHDSQSRNPPNPGIYPKPPRQPASDFSSQSASGDRSGRSNRQHTLPFHPHPRSQSRPVDHNSSGFLDQRLASQLHVSPHPSNNSNSNHFGSSRFDSHGHFVSSFDRRPSNNDQSFDRFRNLRRSPAGQASRLFSPVHYGVSPTENATAALEILSSLCIESGWEWIDGILVGGCLAYGLGDYDKAVRWYTRIIQRDPTHVEAISNLAASFLALDCREDALQHWLRAVKLRPTYFDAAEHLIGLLCSSQRGKDAVNVIQFIENSLRYTPSGEYFTAQDEDESDCESEPREPSVSAMASSHIDKVNFDYGEELQSPPAFKSYVADSGRDGFGSSGYNIPATDNGRMLSLIHAKGNMLYALGDHTGAAAAFEDAILIGAGRRRRGMHSLIRRILLAFRDESHRGVRNKPRHVDPKDIVLLYPDKALQTAKLVFPHGSLPGFQYVADSTARKTAVSTTSNSLLSLAKIYQDGMSSSSSNASSAGGASKSTTGVRDILALYYLSLSLQPSPSTANNVGILLASIQPSSTPGTAPAAGESEVPYIPGVVPGSGIALALAYYNYGLQLDSRHAHLYTNLGSLLKDIGQLPAAVKMYEQAVQCDSNFDIALANLANAVKDSGRINDAIEYYQRAVNANPDFAEAVCGLANALNSVCNWVNRGGIAATRGTRDKWHVDEKGKLRSANETGIDSGWIKRVVDIVNKQLKEGEFWGCGTLATGSTIEQLCALPLLVANDRSASLSSMRTALNAMFRAWSGQKWEGSRIVRFIERAIKWIGWRWYQDRYVHRKEYPSWRYTRPQLPSTLSPPNAPTVLPFHTFTCPLSAKQIRHISQRNGLRISCSSLRSSWLPPTVYPPPAPPNPHLKVGYVSSDFNNHPLAHLMQSVFGLHDRRRVKAFCYATTAGDDSVHRKQIEREAPVFRDVSSWSLDRLVEQIVNDGIHILINLNGYTRGARNEVFAARPAPVQMSFMGFAGTLGADWCDYILADELSVPPETLCRHRRTARIEDRVTEQDHCEDQEDWVYGERIVFTPHTFFCCDHRQSAPDAQTKRLGWEEEQYNRWQMRKEIFPDLSDDTIILGNFNQLYKIEPTTFRTWLFILAGLPNAVLWLLRFPDLGEQNLRQTAARWAGEDIASRIVFTDVAPKHAHISRARICDLFLDTPECNAHTTSADVLWSGTPLLTYPRYKYKMCSRMASSILSSALPQNEMGRQAAAELIASSDSEYERTAIRLGSGLKYERGGTGRARGRLAELRKMLYLNRWESKLFDTKRWVRDLEDAYDSVWKKWVRGEEGDIWL